jgi:hypothetical protein
MNYSALMATPTVKQILERLADEGVTVTAVAGELVTKSRPDRVRNPRVAALLRALREKLKHNRRTTINQVLQLEEPNDRQRKQA